MGTRKRLLIVDDDAVILEILGEFFGTRYVVETAINPARALFLATRGSFDVILIDIRMPGMSGLELLAAIRQAGSTAAAVFMTGYPSARQASEAGRLGAVACLEKPTDLLELDQVISFAARGAGARPEPALRTAGGGSRPGEASGAR